MGRSIFRQFVFFLALAYGFAFGQSSSLNGTWQMNPAKSDFGSGPVSESRVDRISIEGPNVKDTITQKLRRGPESTYDMNYATDGSESENRVRGTLVKSTAKWDGATLVVDSTVFAFRQEMMNDRWSVSADGKTLTLIRHMTGPRRADQKIVFDKQ